MTELGEELRALVLRLPAEDRAELAYFLIRSLDEQEQGDVPSAWEAELERRWQEMERGEVAGQPVEKVFAELRKKYP